VLVGEQRDSSGLYIEVRAKAEVKIDPSGNEHAQEMAMSDNHGISPSHSIFFPGPMEFPNIRHHAIDALSHFLDAFPAGTSVVPNAPGGIDLVDLFRRETFVVAVVPLPDVLGRLVRRDVRAFAEEQLESLLSSLAGRYVDMTQLCGIDELSRPNDSIATGQDELLAMGC